MSMITLIRQISTNQTPFPQPLNILNNYNTKRQNRLSNDLPSSPSDAFQSQSMRKRTQSATAKDFASNVEDRRELSPPQRYRPCKRKGPLMIRDLHLDTHLARLATRQGRVV